MQPWRENFYLAKEMCGCCDLENIYCDADSWMFFVLQGLLENPCLI